MVGQQGKRFASQLISGGESGEAGYNAYNRGTVGNKILGPNGIRDLENMTMGAIMAAQSLPVSDKNRLFAVGKYQMIPDTLKEAATALRISPDTKFDRATQEQLFSEYLAGQKRKPIEQFVKGTDESTFSAQLAGSKEWASVADPRTGRSFYDQKGGNKASISADRFQAALWEARKKYRDHMAAGADEK
jgi:hypothetical protein